MRQIAVGPDIFTNRYAYSCARHVEWLDRLRRLKIAIFVEHVICRQQRLKCFPDRFSPLEQGGGVTKWFSPSRIAIDVADHYRRGTDFAVQFVQPLQRLRHEP